MGAWKQLNQQDAFVTTYNAKKTWNLGSGSLDASGVQVYLAVTSSGTVGLEYDDLHIGFDNGPQHYKKLVYRTLNQLYYQPFDKTSKQMLHSSSFEYYPQSSFVQGNRSLKSRATVYSIPKSMFGTHIEPGSFSLGTEGDEYVLNQSDYVEEIYIYNGKLFDDGEGNLIFPNDSGVDVVVGNIFYAHGLIVLTDATVADSFGNTPRSDMSWVSNHPIYTYNYHCKVSDYEFNVSQNPTTVQGTDNTLRSNITGSAFQPYITTVGLYNASSELIAVGKLSKPLPKPANTELTIQIKLDI